MKQQLSAQKLYTGIAFYMTLFIFLLWWYFVNWPVLVVYLCAINVTTLLLYAYDKMVAILNNKQRHTVRVPEVVLHALALLGGSPMAIVGQKVFRHKTRKDTFQAWQKGVIAVQVLTLVIYIYLSN